MMIKAGVYPAAVTPFGAEGAVDVGSVARLLAYFEASGCAGAVLAGTNGEGPSLSAVEKRDLLRSANSVRGDLSLILGIATPSLTEAQWLCSQAGKNGADAVLVMPPSYFRRATEQGVESWFRAVMDTSPLPVIVYNFPKMTGFSLGPGMVGRLAEHSKFAGLKDSSGELSNLEAYRAVIAEDQVLFVGDELILLEAMKAGWSGSISGAANLVPGWLAKVVSLWHGSCHKEAANSFSVVKPAIETIRSVPQPESNKFALSALGVIDSNAVRLPLEAVQCPELLEVLKAHLGMEAGILGVPVSS